MLSKSNFQKPCRYLTIVLSVGLINALLMGCAGSKWSPSDENVLDVRAVSGMSLDDQPYAVVRGRYFEKTGFLSFQFTFRSDLDVPTHYLLQVPVDGHDLEIKRLQVQWGSSKPGFVDGLAFTNLNDFVDNPTLRRKISEAVGTGQMRIEFYQEDQVVARGAFGKIVRQHDFEKNDLGAKITVSKNHREISVEITGESVPEIAHITVSAPSISPSSESTEPQVTLVLDEGALRPRSTKVYSWNSDYLPISIDQAVSINRLIWQLQNGSIRLQVKYHDGHTMSQVFNLDSKIVQP